MQEALVSELDHSLSTTEQIYELLGMFGSAERIKSCPLAARHYHYMVFHLNLIGYYLSIDRSAHRRAFSSLPSATGLRFPL